MPVLITCDYKCQACKAQLQDHGHDGARFIDMNCPKCGRRMEKHYREVDPTGKRLIHRPDYEADNASRAARNSQ